VNGLGAWIALAHAWTPAADGKGWNGRRGNVSGRGKTDGVFPGKQPKGDHGVLEKKKARAMITL